MSRLLIVALVGCATAPRSAAPTVAAASGPAVAASARAPSPPTRAVRVEGLARFDHVALLEAGLLCGTRAGQAPVCATEPSFMGHAAPYERLHDVAVLAALGTIHCALSGAGVLRCGSGGGAGPHAPPERWTVIARGVADLALAPVAGVGDFVFTLGRDGGVRRHVVGTAAPTEATLVATDARSLANHGAAGVCAVLRGGPVVCSDRDDPLAAMRPTSITDGIAVHAGGAVLRADGSWSFVDEANTLYAPLPPRAIDYAFQALCVLEPAGGVRCAGLGRGWVDVELPAPARRFAPRGYALCAELVDGTTACWGPFLDELVRLGARTPTALAQ